MGRITVVLSLAKVLTAFLSLLVTLGFEREHGYIAQGCGPGRNTRIPCPRRDT